jgi:hypothetical protein
MLRNVARIARTLLLLLIPALLGACSAQRVAPQTDPYQGIVATDTNRLQESLFKGDQEVLSNADIERILSARVTLSDRSRLAVLGLSPRAAWSRELADLDTQNSQRMLQALTAATQLAKVPLMPTLLIPERRTVPYLREAAARFQADLLLIYTTQIQTFRQDRLIGPDEVRAACLAESVLLDVRTGIVAHTTRTSELIETKRSPGDLNFSETVAKAQSEATGRSLVKLADAVVTFLREGK